MNKHETACDETACDQNKGQTVGYIRVSSSDQSSSRQLPDRDILDKIFEEKISGKNLERPRLKEMLGYVRKGDHILVHELSRLGRSTYDLLTIIRLLKKKGVKITFVTERLTYNDDNESIISDLMLTMLSAFAELERKNIKKRQKEGIDAQLVIDNKRREQGLEPLKYKGKPPIKLETRNKIVELFKAGFRQSQIMKELKTSRSTVRKYTAGIVRAMEL